MYEWGTRRVSDAEQEGKGMNYYEPADIVIYIEGRGVVLKEKSLMALDETSGKILAFGNEAERMAKNPEDSVKIVSPLRRGMVAEYGATVKLFLYFLHKAGERKLFHKPAIAVSAPEGMTKVERKALEESLFQAGAGKVYISEMTVEELARKLGQGNEKALKNFHTIFGIVPDEV
jgi:rod shape-determining protein MreB